MTKKLEQAEKEVNSNISPDYTIFDETMDRCCPDNNQYSALYQDNDRLEHYQDVFGQICQ